MNLLDYTANLHEVLRNNNTRFCWTHPRVAAVPGAGRNGAPAVIMTLQKNLRSADFYSGLYVMRTDDLGETWTGPEERPELAWREEPGGVIRAVCDVTPGWHPQTGVVLAIGTKVRYKDRIQIHDKPASRAGAYAVHDPATGAWSEWRMIELPDTDSTFYKVAPGCTQWRVEPDGACLIPVYFAADPTDRCSASTVLRCAFDGRSLTYLEHGDEIHIDVQRGASEPSLVEHRGRYYLTIRNDVKGYVTVGDDGLHFEPIRPWHFDDGAELGSYNTQQHWLAHSDGLFLIYTRRGANNDHIRRHRAPLFIAQVDPERLCVVRATERILIPERGATLGNFGATPITQDESWVTDAEVAWEAECTTFSARVIWGKPNMCMEPRSRNEERSC